MTPDQITSLAKQAGFYDGREELFWVGPEGLQRFAELVRNAAIEECAKAVDKLADGDDADTAQQFALDIASDKIRSLKS